MNINTKSKDDKKTQKNIKEVTKPDNVWDAHAQHSTFCDHFKILTDFVPKNFYLLIWSSKQYKIKMYRSQYVADGNFTILGWLLYLQLHCIASTYFHLAYARTQTHSTTDSYQKRIRTDICDVWPSATLIVFVRFASKLVIFVCVLWVDHTSNLSSIRCYLTRCRLFWFTSQSGQFCFAFLLLTRLLFSWFVW